MRRKPEFTDTSRRAGNQMRNKLRTALMSAAAVTVAAVTVFSAATPAFAKVGADFSGPRAAQAGHAFRLTVSVGDDAGAQPAWARLQVLGAHGRYQWVGTWHRLRVQDRNDESYSFTPAEKHRGAVTFRAVLRGTYNFPTNTVKVAIR
jgi:hypothetical protein